MTDPKPAVVVLAAGLGTRMRSRRPKVMHAVAGRPMLRHVLDTVAALEPARVHVVVGHGADQVRAAVGDEVVWVEQSERLGTGHAVSQALPGIAADATVLVVYGDVPLVGRDTLAGAAGAAGEGAVALVTACLDDPAALGRIVRSETGDIQRIVEYRDAEPQERQIREINSGILAAPRETCDVGLFTEFPGVFGNIHHQRCTFELGGEPLRVSQDFYLTDITNGQWLSPADFAAGYVVTRMFLGGKDLAGALSPFLNDDGLLDRVLVLGPSAVIDVGQFFAPPFHPATNIPENEWFTVMVHMSVAGGFQTGFSVWIKTQASAGGAGTPEDPQFLDPRMADGSIPPVDGEPDGWVDIYPGFPDDHDAQGEPLSEPTPGIIEGIGFAHNDIGQSALPLTFFVHLNQSEPFAALAVTGLQQGFVHSDPTEADPETFSKDAFWDNYAVSGAPFNPCFDLTGPEVICPLTGEPVPTIDGADLGFLLGQWGENPGSPADLNGDDHVNGGDLGMLLGFWGPCPILCP